MVFLKPPPDIAVIAPPPKPPWLDYTFIWNGTHMLKVPDSGRETSALTTEISTNHETTHSIRFVDVSTPYSTNNPPLVPSTHSDTPEGSPSPAPNTIRPDSLPSLSPSTTASSTNFRSTSTSADDRGTTDKLRINDASSSYFTNTLTVNPALPPSVNPDLPDTASASARENAVDLKTTTRRNSLATHASTESTAHNPSSVSTAKPALVPSANSNLPDAASMSAVGNTGDPKTTTMKRNYPNTHASTASASSALSSLSSASTAGYANITDDMSPGLNKTIATKLFNKTDKARRRSDTDGGGHPMVATYIMVAIVGTLVFVLLLLALLLWYKKTHMIGNKVLPRERSNAITHQTPAVHGAHGGVVSTTKKHRRRSSTSSGVSVCLSDDSTKPFVTSSRLATSARPANAVYPAAGTVGFPTTWAQNRGRQTLSSIAPSGTDRDLERQLPDIVQLQRNPNKAASLPMERQLKPPDNAKRKAARRRRRKHQSSAGAPPVDGASCLDTFTPLRVVINPSSETDVSESYA